MVTLISIYCCLVLIAGIKGLELSLDLTTPVIPGHRAVCGVLTCEERYTADTSTMADTSSGISPNHRTISSLRVSRIRHSGTAGGIDGHPRDREYPLLTLTLDTPMISRVSDGVKVDGVLEAKRGTARLEMVKEIDCSGLYSCEVRSTDDQGNQFVQTSRVHQRLRQHDDQADGEGIAPVLLRQLASLQRQISWLGASLDGSLLALRDKVEALARKFEDQETSIVNVENRLEDKLLYVHTDIKNRIGTRVVDKICQQETKLSPIEGDKYDVTQSSVGENEPDTNKTIQYTSGKSARVDTTRMSVLGDVASKSVLYTSEPVLHTSEPVLNASEPVLHTSEPVLDTSEPVLNASEAVLHTSEPVLHTSESVSHTSEAVLHTSEPVLNTSEAVLHTSEPVLHTSEAVLHSSEPVLNASEPILDTSETMSDSVTSKPILYTSNPVLGANKPILDGITGKAALDDMTTKPASGQITGLRACMDGLISSKLAITRSHLLPTPTGHRVLDISDLCDSVTDGEGWIVFQRRSTGGVDFYRDWADYRDGFGSLDGDFWLGNKYIHALTSNGDCELRIELQFNGQSRFAHYDAFYISDEASNYILILGKYDGSAGDSLHHYDGYPFSTFDRDNDGNQFHNIAKIVSGAWWYGLSYNSNLNGKWNTNGSHLAARWITFSENNSVTFSEMKIRKL